MELAFLHIAEYANIADGGKINIMGIFDNLHAPHFPTQHPMMYVVLQLLADRVERGREFSLQVKLVTEDGQELGGTSVNIQVPQPANGQVGPIPIGHVIRLANLVFPAPGTYEFAVLVDNDLKGSKSLNVIQANKPL